ncbi:MAG: hypothetical protein R3C15_21595 [Thermoleophilia bacterium]
MRRLIGGLAALAAGAALLGGPSASGAAACPAGTTSVRVSGKIQCLSLARLRSAFPRTTGSALTRALLVRAGSPALRRALGLPADDLPLAGPRRRASARLAAVLLAAPLAQPRTVQAATAPPSVSDPVVRQVPVEGDDDVSILTGGEIETSQTITKDGVSAQVTRGIVQRHVVARCPTAAGEVVGWAESGIDDRTVGRSPGGLVETRFQRMLVRVDAVAHVGDDALVASTDLEFRFTVQSGGDDRRGDKLVRHHPTRSFRGFARLTGVTGSGADVGDWLTAGTLRELGLWGPKGRIALDPADPILRAFVEGMTSAKESLDTGMRLARIHWYDSAACLDVVWTPGGVDDPGHVLDAGASSPVQLEVRARDGSVVPLRLGLVAVGDAAISAPAVDTTGTVAVTAPAKAGKGEVVAQGTSRRGRALSSLDVVARAADGPPYRYVVVSASFREESVLVTAPSILCGTISGTRTFRGESTPHAADLDGGTLAATSGSDLAGSLEAITSTARVVGHVLRGCRYEDLTGYVPCEVAIPDRPFGGEHRIAVDVDVPQGSSEATLTWALESPTVGFQDAGDDECHVYEWAALPQAQQTQVVPRALLASRDPITLTFTGSYEWVDTLRTGSVPGHMSAAWAYELTLQRVRPDGSPL